MPKRITENDQSYLLYDNCEEYIHIGSHDPVYINLVFTDVELSACCDGDIISSIPVTPTPTISVTPTLTPTPTTTVTPTLTRTPTPTPSVTATVTPTVSITPSITPSISVTPSITPTISVTPTLTPTISITPSVTPSATSTSTPTPTITQSVTPTVSITPTVTPTITITQSITPTPTITPTLSPTPTLTPTPTPTPLTFDILGIEKIKLNDSEGNPYEVISMDYGIPTDEIFINNSHVLAVCAPLNNYNHAISSTLPDISSSVNTRNLLFSTNNYFSQYTNRSVIDSFSNLQSWNYTSYPAGRISSVHYNRDLNRWFLGANSLANEPTIFLYGFSNGSSSKFYIGGDNAFAYYGVGAVDLSMRCGPTKIYSFKNNVILANSYHIISYLTSNSSSSQELDYNHKELAYTCDTDVDGGGNCGIDWSSIASSVTNFYQHLSTIVNNNNGLIVLNNAPKLFYHNNNLLIDGTEYNCISEDGVSSSAKGYFLDSYDFGYSVSIQANLDMQDGIKIEFTKSVNIDINHDISVVINGRTIGMSNITIDKSSDNKTYVVYGLDINSLSRTYINFNLTSITDTSIPSIYLVIPAFNALSGVNFDDRYLKDIRSDRTDPPAFIVKDEVTDNIIEYYVSSSTSCNCGYEYKIKTNNSTTDYILCVDDMSLTYPDSEIKCILCRNGFVYYIVQQSRDPEFPSSDDVYKFNLYKASVNTPYLTTLLAANFGSIRRFNNVNRTINNKWDNTSIIDDKYIILGVPNSNEVFKIDYKNLVPPADPGAAIEPDSISDCNISDNSCFSEFAEWGGTGVFGSNATITGKTSGSKWLAFSVTYNNQKNNCIGDDCYFIVRRSSNSLQYDGSAIEDWQVGERVDIDAYMGTEEYKVRDAFICHTIKGRNNVIGAVADEEYDSLILQCTGTGLENKTGYNLENLILNTNIDFVP